MKCPFCKLDANHPIIWDTRARFFAAIELLLLPLHAYLAIVAGDTFSLDLYRRKCRRCGQIFVGPRKEPPNFDACPKGGYNLTGNVSGRCSECGWQLTWRYRLIGAAWIDAANEQGTRLLELASCELTI